VLQTIGLLISLSVITGMVALAARKDHGSVVRVLAYITALAGMAAFVILLRPGLQPLNEYSSEDASSFVAQPVLYPASNQEWTGHVKLSPIDTIVVVYTERSISSDPTGSLIPGDTAWFGERVRGWAPRLSSETEGDTLGWAQLHLLGRVR
jgi:hypothetical protein